MTCSSSDPGFGKRSVPPTGNAIESGAVTAQVYDETLLLTLCPLGNQELVRMRGAPVRASMRFEVIGRLIQDRVDRESCFFGVGSDQLGHVTALDDTKMHHEATAWAKYSSPLEKKLSVVC